MKKQFNSLMFRSSLFAASILALSSCDDSEEMNPVDENKMGTIELKFDNIAGQEDFAFNKTYQNAAGESMEVDLLQYYISNIAFKTSEGDEYVVPQEESYFMVREQDSETHNIQISNVPEGNYTEVSFIVGVDSLRSTMLPEERTGVLDIGSEAQGMYWSWNSGYIFFKMEGTSSAIEPTTQNPDGRFLYHIGGFGGYDTPTFNNIRKVTLPIGMAAQVRENSEPSVHIVVDVLEALGGETVVSLAEYPVVMGNPFSVNISKNYMSAFEVHHVHND